MKGTTTSLFNFCLMLLLFAVSGCAKEDSTNNNNNQNNTNSNYVELTLDGVTTRYPATATTVGGDRIGGNFEQVPINGRMTVLCNSDNYWDDTKASGTYLTFAFEYAGGVGGATINAVNFTALAGKRQSTGAADPNNNVLWFTNDRYSRSDASSNCVSTTETAAPLVVNFSQWASNQGETTEGLFSGVLYENTRTESVNCQNSEAHAFSGIIHWKR